jgi:predicted metal-binding membrane protein
MSTPRPDARSWPVVLIMVTLAAGAWLAVLYQARSMDAYCGMCSGMSVACPMCMGTGRALWLVLPSFLVMWAAMMAAMMLPAVTPMVLIYSRMAAQRRARGEHPPPAALFVAGYLLPWVATGVIAFAVTRVVQLAMSLSPRLSMANDVAAAVVFAAAGAYQLLPFKDRCLTHCRSPLAFFMQNWRQTPAGVFRMGLSHAAYCLGCCWGLMAVMFAVGLMNLVWMVGLTVVMTLEKVLPAGRLVSRLSGMAFLGVAVYFLVS